MASRNFRRHEIVNNIKRVKAVGVTENELV